MKPLQEAGMVKAVATKLAEYVVSLPIGPHDPDLILKNGPNLLVVEFKVYRGHVPLTSADVFQFALVAESLKTRLLPLLRVEELDVVLITNRPIAGELRHALSNSGIQFLSSTKLNECEIVDYLRKRLMRGLTGQFTADAVLVKPNGPDQVIQPEERQLLTLASELAELEEQVSFLKQVVAKLSETNQETLLSAYTNDVRAISESLSGLRVMVDLHTTDPETLDYLTYQAQLTEVRERVKDLHQRVYQLVSQSSM